MAHGSRRRITMRRRHTPEEIISKLRQVDVLVAQGTPVADAIRAIGVTEVNRDRKLAAALQFGPAACVPGLPPSGSGGGRASFLHPAGSAGQAPRSTQTNHALTLNPDHSVGADHKNAAKWTRLSCRSMKASAGICCKVSFSSLWASVSP